MGLITGFCRAYTDYIIPVSERDFAKIGIEKNCDREFPASEIKAFVKEYDGQFLPGGPVANSIAVAASLGSETAFIGKIANDSSGCVFRDAFTKQNVIFKTPAHDDPAQASGTCVIFVTPDGARSMVYTRGVVDKIGAEDIGLYADELGQTRIFLAGFPLRESALNSSFLQAAKYLSKARVATIMQSISEMTIEEVKPVSRLILERADIIFGNEEEYAKFTASLGFAELKNLAAQYPEKIFCCTLGEKGAVILNENKVLDIPAIATAIMDTTGAGDAFAGGFLHGLNEGKSLEEAAGIAAQCAGQIISQTGARPISDLVIKQDDRGI